MADQEATLTLAFTITVNGQEAGTQEFEQEMVTIGSGAAAVLQIEDDALADLHAAVQIGDDGVVTLLDLGSETGTLLNGEAINNQPVKDGDEVRLGNTVIKLGLRTPAAEEEVTDHGASAAVDDDEGWAAADHAAQAAAEIGEAEDVMEFILRSGTAESDMGINRSAPKILEVAEIWSGTVMNVQHFGKDTKAVYVGDRRSKNIKVASAIFLSILVFGVGFFMIKHSTLPQPPRFPAGDEALIAKWNDAVDAQKKKQLEAKRIKREAELKEIEDEADRRIEAKPSTYEKAARELLKKETETDPATTKTLADFTKKVRDNLIDEIEDEREEAAEAEAAKNAPPDPYRDYKDNWTVEHKKAFDKAVERNRDNEPLVPPQFDIFEMPDWEGFVTNEMLPIAKQAAEKGEVRRSWVEVFRKIEKEYDVYDDLDEKRVAEDLVLSTRILSEDKVWMLIAGNNPEKVYAMDLDGKVIEVGNEDQFLLWAPTEEQKTARTAMYRSIQETLYTNAKKRRAGKAICETVEELLKFEDTKNNFAYNAAFSECLANRNQWEQATEYYERAIEGAPSSFETKDQRDLYLSALQVKSRALLRNAFGGDPTQGSMDLIPTAKRLTAEAAHNDLRDFILETHNQASALKAVDNGIYTLAKEALKEKQQEQVKNAVTLSAFIVLLLPLGFGFDEIRSRKMAQDFFVSSENLPSDHFAIVEQDGASVRCNFTADSVGFLEADDGSNKVSTADLISSGRARDVGGYFQIEIGDDERFVNDIGHMVFFTHKVFRPKLVPGPFGQNVDWAFLLILIALLFVGGSFGIILARADYDPSQEVITIPDRFVELMVQQVEKEKEKKKPAGNPDAGEGAKAKEEEGKTGKKEHKLKKAKGSKVAIQKKELDKQIAESTGLLADLNQMTDNSVFGTGGLDSSVSSALGGLIGSQYGNQSGSGGLGSRGSGYGGGGSAAGLGGLGTRGSGLGGSGYGRGAGFYGKKGGGSPGVGTGDPIILGALDKSIIDRIVKQHLSQIRYCYQKELNKNPKLFGKLVVKFVISKEGTVSSATTKSSTLKNPIVEKCVNARFMRMRFPKPKGGGIVVVSYPFVFNAQGGG